MQGERRSFLLNAAGLAALAAGGGALARNPDGYPFSLGVASGSPLPDAVILWTRILVNPLDATATPPIALMVRWEVAEDEGFKRIVAKGRATAAPELGHSVHVDARGLAPDRWYWYRFLHGDAVSPVGRTRTAPAAHAQVASLRIAVGSCQHWEFGSYAAHRHIAAAAPDLVAFLGDYIYEWGPFQLGHPAKPQRVNESLTLADYRNRYAQYKSDPDLQAAHAVAPWIVTWDDHEVVNDYANDRDLHRSPDFLARRAAAYQAFYEHMPLRLAPRAGKFGALRMHQRYDWGRLARLHVLDDRQYRAHQACQPAGKGGSGSVVARACAELRAPERSMLGAEQERWLADGLTGARARWNIIAQQTLMAQKDGAKPDAPDGARFWTDGWDGYPVARERLLNALRTSRASNPLVLSGDVHTFYAAELRADFDRPASKDNPLLASEFCGTSITSSAGPQARTLQYVAANPHIKYGRSDKRGFILMEVTPARSTAQFMGLDNVQDAGSAAPVVASFRVDAGLSGLIQTS
jgi:alkaline phosphatase D